MWFKKKSSEKESFLARVPAGVRVYAVGDIHGRYDLLQRLQALILEDSQSGASLSQQLIYVGDYVDRGMHSKQVLETLVESPLPGFEITHLKGNHEDALLKFIEQPEQMGVWLQWGGDATLASYGVQMRDEKGKRFELVELAAQFKKLFPESHRSFLRKLPLMHRCGDYVFVHAGVRPGVAIDEQDEIDLLMIREEFLYGAPDKNHVIVFGHTIFEDVLQAPGKIGIDTGAFASGRLTAVVLEEERVRFLST